MGSLERKLKRNQLRRQFDDLGRQWADAKRFQENRLAAGEELQKDEQKLGRKPSFGQFIKRTKALAAMEKIQKELKEKERQEEEKKIDLEWKDE
jgi:hypothetical protein